MFSKSTDYRSKFDESIQSQSSGERAVQKNGIILDPNKSFASADTVDNKEDEDVVERLNRNLALKSTVEAKSDPSISTHDEPEPEVNFSNSPTVDATEDTSISFDEDE